MSKKARKDEGASPVDDLPPPPERHEAPPDPRLGTLPKLPPEPPPVRKPPPTLKGSFTTCGGCGDYVTGDRCPKCSPSGSVPAPENVATVPKIMAGEGVHR